MKPHQGALILALGIASFVTVPFILGPIAWIMGTNDLKEIRAGRMDPEGESLTDAGRICGMIATILSIAGVVVACCVVSYLMFFLGNVFRPGGPN
jgi:hypothetical protein